MFVRLVFLLLLALNLGAGAWLLLGHEPEPAPPPVSDPGVPALRLLSEASARQASGSATPTAAMPEPASPPLPGPMQPAPVSETCHALGPFTTGVDMRAAMAKLAPHVARIQYREHLLSRSHGYWVFMPATATREAALDEARKLAAGGIQDYYVVTAGDAQNTISLGLYNHESNARDRLVELEKQGFAAKLRQRIETEPAFWIDYATPAGGTFDWRIWLTGRNDLESNPVECF